MRSVAIIPARYGSARFPGKALAPVAGRPLIQHVVGRCLSVASLDEVIVATDDERIAAAATEAGAVARMTPEDVASGTDRVALVARDVDADVIVNVQGDEPMLEPGDLDAAIRRFGEGTAPFATLRAPLREARDLWDPNVVKVVVDGDGRALYFSRAPVPFPRDCWDGAVPGGGTATSAAAIGFRSVPTLAGAYWVHVGVYLYRPTPLQRWATLARSRLERLEGLEQLRVLEAGETMMTYAIEAALPGVDTAEDLERVRGLLEERSERPGPR